MKQSEVKEKNKNRRSTFLKLIEKMTVGTVSEEYIAKRAGIAPILFPMFVKYLSEVKHKLLNTPTEMWDYTLEPCLDILLTAKERYAKVTKLINRIHRGWFIADRNGKLEISGYDVVQIDERTHCINLEEINVQILFEGKIVTNVLLNL